MLQNAYFLAKIGAGTAENKRNFAENLPKIGNSPPTGRLRAGAPRRREELHGEGEGHAGPAHRGAAVPGDGILQKLWKFLAGWFSAVPRRNFPRKYVFDSIFQTLQDLHTFAPQQSQNFSKKSV